MIKKIDINITTQLSVISSIVELIDLEISETSNVIFLTSWAVFLNKKYRLTQIYIK